MDRLAVVAIGGNSLIKDAGHMTVLDQYLAAGETSHHLVFLVESGYRLLITHGNGPQVGFILLRSETARNILHQVPLESCVADTQGAIGYQLAQTIMNELHRRKLRKPVASVITQVLVDANDPAIKNPSKPIGPFYTKEDAEKHAQSDGWAMKEDAGRGWRRVVASPEPKEIIEEDVIRQMLDNNIIVIAVGGGGIPVVRDANGELQGCPAVIDKDMATALLAGHLKADLFVISTGVDQVAINFGKPNQKNIARMTVAEARQYMKEGHFAAGSMLPKIIAAINFLEQGGREVIITQPHKIEAAVRDGTGTHIVP